MNMRIAKDEMTLLNPAALSRYAADYAAEPRYAAAPQSKGFFALLRSVVRWVAELPERQAGMAELNNLSDRELADIGLNRADVPHVYEEGFKSSYR